MTDNDTASANEITSAEGANIVQLPATTDKYADRPVAKFVHEHPVMTIAGGLAVGAVAAALIPRRNRRYVARQSSALADAVSTASLAMLTQALEKADAARSDVRDHAGALADRASRLGGIAASKAQGLIGRDEPDTIAEKLAASAGKLRDRLQR